MRKSETLTFPETDAMDIKTLLLQYFRFNRGCNLVSYEYKYGHIDVIACNIKQQIAYEIEIKISINDLKNELKKHKYALDTHELLKVEGNYFYFAVPEPIKLKAKEIIEAKFPHAGLLCVHNYIPLLEKYNKPYAPYYYVTEIIEPKKVSGRILTQNFLNSVSTSVCNNLCSLSYQRMRAAHNITTNGKKGM
jgi:hypothetical protein